MNLYTFNSKKLYQLYFLIFLLSLLIFSALVKYILLVYLDQNMTKNYFVEEPRSKLIHYQSQQDTPFDYLFFGNSRTLFHINTNMFKKHHLSAYNFGISGADITQQKFLIQQVITAPLKPKNIVISLDITQLYIDNRHQLYNRGTLDDVVNAIKLYDICMAYYMLLSYLESSDLSYRLMFLLKQDLKAFLLANQDNNNISMPIEEQKKFDCRPFNYTNATQTVMLCKNGDGVIIKEGSITQVQKVHVSLNRLNYSYLHYLQKLSQDIKCANINPIIILQPIHNKNLTYNLKNINDILDKTTIIDLSTSDIENTYWADQVHLNYLGRAYYTNKLIHELRKF